jgi:EmrB/QacA subfamily drug resistance transporter
MLLIDITIVQVALPSIQRDLHASFTNLQWVIDAYALTLAALLLTSGALSDRFGRKRIFVCGVVVFTFASLLCGLAPTATWLNLARGLQGVGGAAMFATGLALIAQDFSGRERGTAIAIWGSTVGGAVAVGPLVGGVLTEGLGWEWIFFVNLPIGAAVLAIAALRMRNVRDPEAKHVDLAGFVTFSVALFLLIFSLLRGNALGWSSTTIVAALAGAAVLMAAFLVVERRQSRPMLDLTLFRRRAFSGVSVSTFAIGAGMFAMFPYITFYFQNLLGYSPLQGGLRLLPATLLVFIVPLATRTRVARIPGGTVLGVGMALTAGGLFLMHGLTVRSHWTALLPGLILTGVGVGLCNPAIATIALGVVPAARSGMASGISNTFRLGGLATGVAALGAIFQHEVQAQLASLLPPALLRSCRQRRLQRTARSCAARTGGRARPGGDRRPSRLRLRHERDLRRRRDHRGDRRDQRLCPRPRARSRDREGSRAARNRRRGLLTLPQVPA